MPILTSTGAFRAWWALFMVLVAAVLVAGASIAYTNHIQRENNQKWCDLLMAEDQPSVPATTERGRQIQYKIHKLRLSLGCGGAK